MDRESERRETTMDGKQPEAKPPVIARVEPSREAQLIESGERVAMRDQQASHTDRGKEYLYREPLGDTTPAEIAKDMKTEEAKAAAEKASKHLIKKENVLSNNFRDNKGKLPWPTDGGIITRGFGEYQHPIYKDVKFQSLGIEITTSSGSNVHAVFEGEVASILYILGTNYTILIMHGNFFTVYQNVVEVKVKKGEKVKINQIIGKVFTDNVSKATILRMQIWEEKKNLDPELWLYRN